MGFFVSFEGIDGAGKTTQVKRLAERLLALGYDLVVVREPGETRLGEEIRAIVKDPARDIDSRAEACLYAAARAELVAKVILPALETGKLVLADRFADSTLAYQGAGQGLPEEFLRAINLLVTQGITPDLTIIIDLPVAVALRRLRLLARDRIEQLGPTFLSAVREYYLRLAAGEPGRFVVVNGDRSPEEVEEEIFRVVQARLQLCTRQFGVKSGR